MADELVSLMLSKKKTSVKKIKITEPCSKFMGNILIFIYFFIATIPIGVCFNWPRTLYERVLFINTYQFQKEILFKYFSIYNNPEYFY